MCGILAAPVRDACRVECVLVSPVSGAVVIMCWRSLIFSIPHAALECLERFELNARLVSCFARIEPSSWEEAQERNKTNAPAPPSALLAFLEASPADGAAVLATRPRQAALLLPSGMQVHLVWRTRVLPPGAALSRLTRPRQVTMAPRARAGVFAASLCPSARRQPRTDRTTPPPSPSHARRSPAAWHCPGGAAGRDHPCSSVARSLESRLPEKIVFEGEGVPQ